MKNDQTFIWQLSTPLVLLPNVLKQPLADHFIKT